MVEIILKAEIKALNEYTNLATNEKKYIVTALIENTGKQFKFEWKNNLVGNQTEFSQLQDFITKFNRKVLIVTDIELHELENDGMFAIELAINEEKALRIKRLITSFEDYQIDAQEKKIITKEIQYENGSIDEVIIKEPENEIEQKQVEYIDVEDKEVMQDKESEEVDNTRDIILDSSTEIEKDDSEQINEKESKVIVEKVNETNSQITIQDLYKNVLIDKGFDSSEVNEFVKKFDIEEGPIKDYLKCLVLYSTTQKHSYYEFIQSFKKLTTISPITEEPFFVDVMRKRMFSDPIKERFITIKRKISEENSQEQLLNKLAEVLNKLENEVSNNDN